MLWPKKNSYKEFDNEKEFLRLENSLPPPPGIIVLMVSPLREMVAYEKPASRRDPDWSFSRN